MDVPSVVNRFHRIILAWDYFGLRDRSEQGKGVYDELQPVPNTFESMQVSRPPGPGVSSGELLLVADNGMLKAS